MDHLCKMLGSQLILKTGEKKNKFDNVFGGDETVVEQLFPLDEFQLVNKNLHSVSSRPGFRKLGSRGQTQPSPLLLLRIGRQPRIRLHVFRWRHPHGTFSVNCS